MLFLQLRTLVDLVVGYIQYHIDVNALYNNVDQVDGYLQYQTDVHAFIKQRR